MEILTPHVHARVSETDAIARPLVNPKVHFLATKTGIKRKSIIHQSLIGSCSQHSHADPEIGSFPNYLYGASDVTQ